MESFILTEDKRKDAVFNSLKSILEAIGSFLNDNNLEFKRETRGEKEYLVYSSVYGKAEQNITGDSVKSFLEDSLTLLFSNCRELQSSFNAISKNMRAEK